MLKRLITFIVFFILVTNIMAQEENLSAVIEVIGEDIFFLRDNTETELSLPLGAVAPFGIGDRIRTEGNGRVLIHMSEDLRLLVLPNSEYEITAFSRDDSGQIQLEGQQSGIVLHNFDAPSDSYTYALDAIVFDITQANGHFLVWNVPNGLRAVTNASGEVSILSDDTEYTLIENTGFSISGADEVISLSAPLHASQVVGESVNCDGVVNTSGSQGLRLRAGAALDYQIVDILQDGQMVQITGTTENGSWYRIPFQTGFGWIFSSLIDASCEDLAVFPNLIREDPERIIDATALEIELLEPFYGTPETNLVFYR